MKEKGLESDEIVMETAQDLEDNWNEQLARFKPLMKTARKFSRLQPLSCRLIGWLAGSDMLVGSIDWLIDCVVSSCFIYFLFSIACFHLYGHRPQQFYLKDFFSP